MLILNNIVKDYAVKDNKPVHALKNVSLVFEDTGFVSILGPSGCGKTTLLNIIGGLDKYTSGDVIINGQSTKDYNDQDWDAYRNREIGIVFQSYNLIPHLSVKANVELAMTLSGTSKKERDEKALKALEMVGLKEQVNKKPNQLSGGQMQRVALARALVNEPNIILADEPTGALDSVTSVQVMDILKEISKTKSVIIVTHNEKLALEYSDRIIRVSDGVVVSDSKMKLEEEKDEIENEIIKEKSQADIRPKAVEKPSLFQRIKAFFSKKDKHTSMSYPTALGISGKNLLTKKGKTIITAIAASFGIIGVGLVLALSNGFTSYVNRMEQETMSQFPMTIEKYGYSFDNYSSDGLEAYPEDEVVHVIEPNTSILHNNNINKDFVQYLNGINAEEEIAQVRYNYSIGMNVISRYGTSSNYVYSAINTSQQSYTESMASSMLGGGSSWKELPASQAQILEQYDILAGSYPDESQNLVTDSDGKPDQDVFNLVLVVDSRNSLSTNTMLALGLDPIEKDYSFSDLIGTEFKYIPSDAYYGDAIDKSELDDNGNQVSVTTPGFYFKDNVTITQIMNLMNEMSLEGSDFDMSELFDLFDLPTSEEMLAAISDPDVSASLLSLTQYLDTSMLATIMSKLQSDEEITASDLQALLSPLAEDEDKRAEFGVALRDFIRALRAAPSLSDHFNKQLKYYEEPSGDQARLAALYNGTAGNKTRTLRISAILRQKDTTSLGLLSSGIYYPKTLTYQTFYDNSQSEIAQEFKNHILLAPGEVDYADVFSQAASDILSGASLESLLGEVFADFSIQTYNVINNANPFTTSQAVSDYMNVRLELGSDFNPDAILSSGGDIDFLDSQLYADFVSNITIYPVDYDAKQKVVDYLNAYNVGKAEADQIIYTDVGQTATDIVGQIVSVISAVLIAFASISLVVSSVMIAILIYSSVVERTKEIGVLRSIGARKKDVSRLFKAEAVIIGLLSGLIGVIFTYLISLPISAILNFIFPEVALGQICFLNPWHALLLVAISAVLTYIASLIPSRIAARKDPVTCLRTE